MILKNQVDIRDAEANMDRLIEGAEKGRPFTISVNGKPLVKVSRIPFRELEELPEIGDDLRAELGHGRVASAG